MDFLTRKLRDFRGIFTKEEEQLEEKKGEIDEFKLYIKEKYKSWEGVSLLLSVFLVFHFLFWLVIQLQLRFFGVIFVAALVRFLMDTCLDGCTLTEFSCLKVLDLLKDDLVVGFLSLKALRKDSPSAFCYAISILCLSAGFIGRNVPGYLIIYFILMGMIFVPMVLTKVQPEYIAPWKQFLINMASERGVLAEDELIPYEDFDRGAIDDLFTDKTADSANSSLISGLRFAPSLQLMPSHLDAEDKESLEEEDFLPGTNKHGTISLTPGDISSDSDSDNRGIRFESTHFNGDSSSEEEIYAKNLNFANADNRDSAENDVVSNLLNVAAMGDNLMRVASMIKNVVSPSAQRKDSSSDVVSPSAQRKDSSSDSDFEMINFEEAEEH